MFPLGAMPSFEMTEEMKKQALKEAIRNAGFGMMGAAMNGANTGEAFARGLLGGADYYQSAPQRAQKAWESQLDTQKKWISANKDYMELAKLGRDQQDYTRQQDFFSMLMNPGQAAMAGGGGPSVANLNTAQGYQANPSAMVSDPRIGIRALTAGVDPNKLGAIAQNARPYKMEGGNFYVNPMTGQREYLPSIDKNMTMDAQGRAMAVPGAQEAINALKFGEKSGELAAQLRYDAARVPIDIQRESGIAGARDQFGFQTIPGPNGAPIAMTNPQARSAMGGAANMYPGVRVSPQEQAQRDAVRGQILQSEGLDPNMPTRLNDRRGNGGLQPQIGIVGQAPATLDALKQTTDRIGKARDAAGQVADSLAALEQAASAVQSGAYQGRFADFKSAAAAIESGIFGGNAIFDANKLANSQTATKHLSDQILAKIKSLGTNPSNTDREFIEKTIPQLVNDPTAFSRLINFTRSMYARSLESHNKNAENYHKAPGLSPDQIGTDYRINIPESLSKQREAVRRIMQNGSPEAKRKLMQEGWVL